MQNWRASKITASLLAMFLLMTGCGPGDRSPNSSQVLTGAPMIGTCEGFTLRGSGYPAGEELSIRTVPGGDMNVSVLTDASGSFEAAITSELLNQCEPGQSYSFEVGDASTQLRIYQPGALSLDPPRGTCSTDVTIKGSGFPSGAEVLLRASAPESNNYVPIATTNASDAGEIVLRAPVGPPLGLQDCPANGELRITAVGEGFGVWSAVYEFTPE